MGSRQGNITLFISPAITGSVYMQFFFKPKILLDTSNGSSLPFPEQAGLRSLFSSSFSIMTNFLIAASTDKPAQVH